MDGIGSANWGMTGICDGLCIGLLRCSSREPCIGWGKKEELFYSLSPLFIDTSLLVLVIAIKAGHYPLACFNMFTSCVMRCSVQLTLVMWNLCS